MIYVQEELFDRLYFFAQDELGFDTYDSLPRDGTKRSEEHTSELQSQR